MSSSTSDPSWPLEQLGEAIIALARRHGLTLRTTTPPEPPTDGRLEEWLVSAARVVGVEVRPVTVSKAEMGSFLRSGAPAIVGLEGDRFLLVTGGGSRSRTLHVLDERGRKRHYPVEAIEDETHQARSGEVSPLLDALDLKPEARRRARERLLDEPADVDVGRRVWLLRERPGVLRDELKDTRLVPLVLAFVSTYAIDYGLFVLSWWLIGRGALSGRIDWGLFSAWALLLLTMLPFRMLSTWYEGKVAVAAGGLLKRRLLLGAMRLGPDETRRDGVGRHLARVFESEAVESLALSGGLLSAAAILELVVATFILALGAGGFGHAMVLIATLLVLFVATSRYVTRRRLWTDARLQASHELVELLVGHRTRLAQLPPDAWHLEEDERLSTYLAMSRDVDRLNGWLSIAHRAFVPVGLLGLAPALIGGGASVERIAIGLGGVILASRGLKKLTDGLSQLLDAVIAWERVEPLFRAAGREPLPGNPEARFANEGPLITAEGLGFHYLDRAEATIRNLHFRLASNEHVLLTSPSGGGKSTLISLLNGLRTQTAGRVRLKGLDRESVGGEAWTQRIATAPQFHENHVFTETFAFNLLMARRWPPTWEDWREAERLARELGLGELLEKMPGGMQQLVGETGWQLSHGERSRMFLARALLQRGDLVLLDESFAALDPENLRRAIACARDRAKALVVVAHP